MAAIRTANLTKFYGRSRGITDVSLTVEEGDFFGFIGPNGAGKSTTIRTLLGLIAPSSGTATVLGQDITAARTTVLHDIGYLPSEAVFYNGMKVKELLRFSARLHQKDCHAETAALCERLELDPDRRIDELSLGNRKKVGIVAALQHKPRLYILDEPTSGLDPLMQREFYDILKERNNEGATVFLSSHILSEVARHCKTAAVIREGRILICDHVTALGHTGVKRVQLRGCLALPPTEGMRDLTVTDDSVTFLYSGNQHDLLHSLRDIPFEDITIADPDLEEVFMHYYTAQEESV